MIEQGLEFYKFLGRIWIDGHLRLEEQSAPATPPADNLHFYAKDKSSVAELYYKNDAGVERDLSLVALLPASFTASRMAASDASGVLASLGAQTQGAILFGNGSTQTFDIDNLAWNNTTKVLGIGLANPVFPNGGGLQIYRSDFPRLTLANSTTGALASDGYGLVGVGLDLYLENREAGNLIFTTTDTERFRIGALGQLGIGGATYGTSGQVLLSGGALAPPTWGSAGVTDHGALTGLTDDDHTQYGLKSGTLAQFAATTSAQLFSVINDETGGSGILVGNDSPTFTTLIETPKIIGGTAATSTLILQSTSGVGTTDQIIGLIGNNGARLSFKVKQNSDNSGTWFAIGSVTPVFQSGAGRDVLALYSIDVPVLEFGTQAGDDRDDVPHGVYQVTDSNLSTGDKRLFLYDFRTDGTTATNRGGKFIIYVKPNGAGIATVSLTLRQTGSLCLGSENSPSGGGPVMAFIQGSDPTGIGANTAGIYAKDVGGLGAELFAFDENANFVQLTPHPNDFLNTLPLEDRSYPWAYNACNPYIGKCIKADMAGLLAKLILKGGFTPADFIKVMDLPPEEKRDWDTDQELVFQSRLKQQAAWDRAPVEDRKIPRPLNYTKRRPPYWMEIRGVASAIPNV